MPKVSWEELSHHLDPDAEDYRPTDQELEEEAATIEYIRDELAEIMSYLLRGPDIDLMFGSSAPVDPEIIIDRIYYLRNDHFGLIRDPDERLRIAQDITKIEKMVFKSYLPFIADLVSRFGYYNSPLEKKSGSARISIDEIESAFNGAERLAQWSELKTEEMTGFTGKLAVERERFELYQKEPTYFTFESICREIGSDLNDMFVQRFTIIRSHDVISLGHDDSEQEEGAKLDEMMGRAHEAVEIADRMYDHELGESGKREIVSLMNQIDYWKEALHAPKELLSAEARARDLLERLRNGGDMNEQDEQFIAEAEAAVRKYLGVEHKLTKKLERVLRMIEMARDGVFPEEEMLDFYGEEVGGAWAILGVRPDADVDTIVKAYRERALKYHPDLHPGKDTEKMMKKLNEAYKFCRDKAEDRQKDNN